MKKTMIGFMAFTMILSTVLASCTVGGGTSSVPRQTQQPVRSYSEKASYYDALVAGDSDPIPLTTALNKSVTIEGDTNLLEEDLYKKIVEISNQVFPSLRNKYSPSYLVKVSILLDASSAGYNPCYTAGETVLLNADWINNHPGECDIIIEGFASVIMNYGHKDQIPSWLLGAMKLYMRDEFALYRSESSFNLPKRYNGKSYENDSNSGAAFLKWIKNTYNVDIVERLNQQLRSAYGYRNEFWKATTDKTLDQLWAEYKNA